jgi:TetR/AcrR family transcriptional repressor of nem operon
MKLSQQQVRANHRRIVDTSVRAFKRRGVESVGMNEVMRDAGFTHGGFYNHFESKDALVTEAFDAAFAPAIAVVEEAATTAETLARAIAEYLTVAHRDAPEDGCPTAALAVGTAGQSREVREAFSRGIAAFLRAFERQMSGPEEAMTTLSGMVGAMVLARAIGDADEPLSRALLGAQRKASARRKRR